MTFEQFLDKVDKFYYENEFELRYGQSIMNRLYQVRPDLYKNITQTDLDCFYDDGIVIFTLNYLEKYWNNNDNISLI
jgi:hypothetical protein